MLSPDQIKKFFPAYLWSNKNHQKLLIKEYLQLLILDFLTTTPFIRKIVFIGGTSLRLRMGIDRFSEDIDFDCKNLLKEEFMKMTDRIIEFLRQNGLNAQAGDKANDKLKAFRRNIYFPELLFELGLSGYREERFLIKIESQDQKIEYPTLMSTIKGCGMYFKFPVPADDVLCSMKILALLSRQKGRDFYDVMFLLAQTPPDYNILEKQCGISNLSSLKSILLEVLKKIDLKHKSKDFEHLVFTPANTNKILHFEDFINEL